MVAGERTYRRSHRLDLSASVSNRDNCLLTASDVVRRRIMQRGAGYDHRKQLNAKDRPYNFAEVNTISLCGVVKTNV